MSKDTGDLRKSIWNAIKYDSKYERSIDFNHFIQKIEEIY